MLVVSRYPGEAIIAVNEKKLEDSLIFKVLSTRTINGTSLKIGIQVPSHIRILRDEIFFKDYEHQKESIEVIKSKIYSRYEGFNGR